MEDRHIPKIRYSSFTKSWKKKSLLELMTFSNGINASKESYGIGRRMISVMDILQEGPIIYEKIRNAVQVEDEIEQKNKVENGDLVFVRSSETVDEVGIAKAYSQRDYALFSGFTIRGKRKSNYDAKFIELSLNTTNRKQIERKAGGSTRFNVSQFLLNSIEIFQPSIEEQAKIGEFFTQLDETISLQQQELDTLKQTKQGFLQKMFPKEGESVPELRFPGFDTEWDLRSLGEISPLRGGFAFQSAKFKKNGVPIVRISNIQSNGEVGGDYAYYDAQSNDEKFVLKDKSALLAMSGATTGKVAILKNPNNEKVYQNQRVGFFTNTDKVNYDFISIAVRSPMFTKQLKSVLVSGAQPNISSKEIDLFEFFVPKSKEEQIQIGNFFKQLDEVIALHQQELDALKQTKKAFLQKMFV